MVGKSSYERWHDASKVQINVHIHQGWVKNLTSLLHWENKNINDNTKTAIEAGKIPIALLGMQDIQLLRTAESSA